MIKITKRKLFISPIFIASILFLYTNNTITAQQKPNNKYQNFDSYTDIGYDQTYRPQFHFTSLKNWINDPNGMMYYDGEYHLFFQHNPLGVKWGNMTWGHAVSTDMLHWKQLPHAIMPYDSGTIWSGSGVVDQNNTLKMQKGDTKTLVCMYTMADEAGPYYQALAYSTDKGRTFKLYNDGKPVIPNQELYKHERDPKLLWHEPTQKWITILWVQSHKRKNSENRPAIVRFFSSEDLINWEVESDFHSDWAFECMDFVELTVDGDKDNKKWVLYDASYDYEYGTFDGKTFTSESEHMIAEKGYAYAGQSFNNSPDGRVVYIGWITDSYFPVLGMPFSQQMSIPNTLNLKTTADGIKLFRWPIKEIESLYNKSWSFNNISITEASKTLSKIDIELIDMSIEIEPKSTNIFIFNLRGLEFKYDITNKDTPTLDMNYFKKEKVYKAPKIRGNLNLRIIVDRGSIELFINNGEDVYTCCAIPDPFDKSINITGDGDAIITNISIHSLNPSMK